MFSKLEMKHLEAMKVYFSIYADELAYLLHPFLKFESGAAEGVFYGFIKQEQLQGVFYFSNKSVMTLHCMDLKILGNLTLLKAIKHHKPRFVKGTEEMTEGIYRLICRTVKSTKTSNALWMAYDAKAIAIRPFGPYSSETKISEAHFNDMRFFIEVQTHFGAQVKAINDMVKSLKQRMIEEDYLLVLKDQEIIAQGFIEDETETLGFLSGIYVTPKYRGQGIGEKVSLALTHKLLERNKRPTLFVIKENQSARRLYEKIGYKVIKPYAVLTIVY